MIQSSDGEYDYTMRNEGEWTEFNLTNKSKTNHFCLILIRLDDTHILSICNNGRPVRYVIGNQRFVLLCPNPNIKIISNI